MSKDPIKPKIREVVMEVLSDGHWHTTTDICYKVVEKTGRAFESIRVELSSMRDLRTIERGRSGIGFRYRRTNVEAPAA